MDPSHAWLTWDPFVVKSHLYVCTSNFRLPPRDPVGLDARYTFSLKVVMDVPPNISGLAPTCPVASKLFWLVFRCPARLQVARTKLWTMTVSCLLDQFNVQ